MMFTWFGILCIGLYVLVIAYNLVRIGQGGYVVEWTVGQLVWVVILQLVFLAGILFVGTGTGF